MVTKTKKVGVSQGLDENSISDGHSFTKINHLVEAANYTSHSRDLIEWICDDPTPSTGLYLLPNRPSSSQYILAIQDPLFDKLLWNLNTFPALAFPIMKPEIRYQTCHSEFEPPVAKKCRLSKPSVTLAPSTTCQASLLHYSDPNCLGFRKKRQVVKRRRRIQRAMADVANVFAHCKKKEEREPDGFDFLRVWLPVENQVIDLDRSIII